MITHERRTAVVRAVLVGALLVVASAAPAVAATPSPSPSATVDRTITDPRITESSGLVASAGHPGVLWTHDDSGNPPLLFAIGRDGRTVAAIRVRGTENTDWEALAGFRGADGRPRLAVGDIGDNAARRDHVEIVVLPEPALQDATVRPERRLTLRYPDGPHDAEALLVDPAGRRMLVATKGFGSTIYEVPPAVFGAAGARTSTGTMRRLVSTPLVLVTDGLLAPSGRPLLRTYGELAVLPPIGEDVVGGTVQPVAELPLPAQQQGEGLALHGDRVLLSSEGRDQPVVALPLPAEVTRLLAGPAPPPAAASPATASATPAAQGGADGRRSGGVDARGTAYALLAVIVALTVGGLFAVRRLALGRRR